MKFTPASLGKMFEGYKDDGVTQDMILMQMYRVNGFFASIVGAGINTGYSALYAALDTSHGANGIDEFFKVINKDYKGLSDGMEQIEKAFAGNSKFES